MAKRGLTVGWGINDADYCVVIAEELPKTGNKRNRKTLWTCPYYLVWRNMLVRCFKKSFQDKNPAYIGCTVSEDWKFFSNFKLWMEQQDWEGKELDKDLLIPGNKLYSADTCVFLSNSLNGFLTERTNHRGKWPLGVHFHKQRRRFVACCSNPITGRSAEHIGLFDTPEEAHTAWRAKKHMYACWYAGQQSDKRVAEALRSRYMEGGYYDV